ncbi:hypothetical protein EDB89DRAFT_119978 [Lactarius sanguifluus]|nr:hypothetical protein EDB89DRAFT_119978 [Lactarius sanguifluus]
MCSLKINKKTGALATSGGSVASWSSKVCAAFLSRFFLFDIFLDTSGVLKGEQLVRSSSSSSTQDNWWHYEQPVISPDSESLARLSHNCLRPIITNPSANPTLGFPLEDWSSLSRPALHFINIHIYDASRPPRSLEALDLPPLAPTSERPEYRARYTSIDTLCNDILLSICNYYRLDDENNWNIRLGWCKLTHVCRGWRRLVHDSASYLGMHILCTNGNPTVDTLDHLSFLPLVVDYQDVSATIGAQDKLGMSHALQLRDRVRRVDLHIPPSNLRELHELHVLDGSFPILEHLSLSPSTEDDRNLILPTTF